MCPYSYDILKKAYFNQDIQRFGFYKCSFVIRYNNSIENVYV